VQSNVIPRGFDPFDLFGAEEHDFATRLHDDARISPAMRPQLGDELFDEGPKRSRVLRKRLCQICFDEA
jgi:hypothetical protein